MDKYLRRLHSVLLAGLALTVAPLLPPATPTPATEAMNCQQVLRSDLPLLVKNWKITCAVIVMEAGEGGEGASSQWFGFTDFRRREVVIAEDTSPASARTILLHELGHAWAEDNLTPQEKLAVAHSDGYEGDWAEGTSQERPLERWARSWEVCSGSNQAYPGPTYPCSLLRTYDAPIMGRYGPAPAWAEEQEPQDNHEEDFSALYQNNPRRPRLPAGTQPLAHGTPLSE